MTVSVSDSKDAGGNADTAADDTIDVTISVTNVNEQPAFSTDTATRSVAENTAAGENIGAPVEATDDDDGDSLTYTLGGTDAASFEIVAASGQLQTRSALDFETKALYSVIVSVSDRKDAAGASDTVVDDTIDVTISVTNVNEQPAFSTDTATRSVAENTAAGTDIGAPVEATDDDDGDSLTYTLGGTDASSFAIVEGSGQLQTRSALDFETKSSYFVTVSVSDKKDAGGNADTVVDDTIDVTISVTNVNEQPAFSTDTATRSVAENTAAGTEHRRSRRSHRRRRRRLPHLLHQRRH